jgi:predicted metal-binding membrane protein
VNLIAWSLLALDGSGLIVLPVFCSIGPPSAVPLSASFNLALVLNSPASMAWGWALMVVAMMSPLIVPPLRHVHDRSFARRRARSMLLFATGYAAVWMVAGAWLQCMALIARWAVPSPFVCLSLVAAVAISWQISPAKQWCLNICHRRPHLAAFGAAADLDTIDFALRHGAACVGTCWALMLLTLVVAQGHVLAMAAVMLFVVAERLEGAAPLAWRWRGADKAVRIARAQACMRLVPWRHIREVSP